MKTQFLYLIRDTETNYLKIGISVDPFKRIRTLQTGSPNKLILEGIYVGGRSLEKKLHKMFWESRHRSNGEWFKFEPFEDYIDFIKELLKDCEVKICSQ